jgi:hypothetical protein
VGFFGRLSDRGTFEPGPDLSKPFVEHPSGEFESAKDATAAAIRRLDRLPTWGRWITFGGQGQGSHADACHFEDVKVRGRTIEVGPRAAKGVFLDALFPVGLGVRPFEDYTDHAVGAGW